MHRSVCQRWLGGGKMYALLAIAVVGLTGCGGGTGASTDPFNGAALSASGDPPDPPANFALSDPPTDPPPIDLSQNDPPADPPSVTASLNDPPGGDPPPVSPVPEPSTIALLASGLAALAAYRRAKPGGPTG
jgi:hypothetical protein